MGAWLGHCCLPPQSLDSYKPLQVPTNPPRLLLQCLLWHPLPTGDCCGPGPGSTHGPSPSIACLPLNGEWAQAVKPPSPLAPGLSVGLSRLEPVGDAEPVSLGVWRGPCSAPSSRPQFPQAFGSPSDSNILGLLCQELQLSENSILTNVECLAFKQQSKPVLRQAQETPGESPLFQGSLKTVDTAFVSHTLVLAPCTQLGFTARM